LNIPLIIAISVGVALFCGCIFLVLTTGLGLSFLDFFALNRGSDRRKQAEVSYGPERVIKQYWKVALPK